MPELNASPSTADVQTETILIVDDNDANRFSIKEVLLHLEDNPQDTDRVILTAPSGEEAIKIIQRENVDLILLDIQMPDGINGFETATRIRQLGGFEKLPILFMSAVRTSEIDIELGYQLGAFDYISKPINPNLLKCRVEVFLRLERQRKKLLASHAHQETQLSERIEELSALWALISKTGQKPNLDHTLKQYSALVDVFSQPIASADEIQGLALQIAKIGGGGIELLSCYFESLKPDPDKTTYEVAEQSARARQVMFQMLSELVSLYSDSVGRIFRTPLLELAPKDVVTVTPATTIGEAANALFEASCAAALVCENHELLGLVNESDMTRAMTLPDFVSSNTAVRAVMTPSPESVPASAPIAVALRLMCKEKYGAIPLVNAAGDPCGLVTMQSIIEFLGDQFPQELLNPPYYRPH